MRQVPVGRRCSTYGSHVCRWSWFLWCQDRTHLERWSPNAGWQPKNHGILWAFESKKQLFWTKRSNSGYPCWTGWPLVAFASLTKIKRQLSIYCFFFQLFFWKLKSDANQTTTQSRQKIHLGPCHLEISTQSFLRQRFWNLEPPITLEAFGRWSSILGYWKLAAFLYCYVRNHLLHGHKFGTFIFSQRFFALGLISELKSQYIGAGHWGVL